ncbi:hypothetical protein [Sphingomonas sp. Ant20]|jgi:hypothetical protein|uniref:hypothetical protein n=1 Tax=Sphingomonas sp. Ant20 TaxID=104605 RepID=UPI00053735B4|nr:hypothetical protein [Sphingomonas sp. Ant20]KHA63118.1 hypothetical protein NI18_18485 [Sphingomonas sp. Ant20]
MSPPADSIRLVVTIRLGQDGHDATVEKVANADDPGILPDIPAFGRAMESEPDRPGLSEFEQFRSRKRLAQCLLMDQYDTPNGDKAIAVALHRHWTPLLKAVFGRPDDPSSIRRWRRTRGRPGSRRLIDMLSSSRMPIDDAGSRRRRHRPERQRRG